MMITHQVLVKLSRQACPRKNFAFPAQVSKIVTRTCIPSCLITPNFRGSQNKDSSIEHQLRKLTRDVKQAAPLNIFISDLLPLEKSAYWSKRLQVILETYAKVEAARNERAFTRQSDWLKTYLTTNKLAIESRVVRWGRVQGTSLKWIPLFIYRKLTAGEEWVFQRLGIQKGATRWQWRVPLSILKRHYSNLYPFLPGISNLHTAISQLTTNYTWGQTP